MLPDQGVDEAFVDLVAEAGADQPSDRIAGILAVWQQRLDGGPCLAARAEQPARRQGRRVPWDAEEQPVGDAVQPVVPDEGGRRHR